MRKTLLAMAMALMATTALAAKNDNDVGVEINDPQATVCEMGTLDEMLASVDERDMRYVVLEGDTLAAFATAVKEKFGIDKPEDIVKLIVQDFYTLDSDPVVIVHIDENDCLTGQSTWDAEFMKSAITEDAFKASE